MTREIDHFYLEQQEPAKGCLIALRHIILSHNADFSEAWKYKMPFFLYKGKMFCYLWIHKKTKMPYIGIVEGIRISHPDLVLEKRARMKILFVNPSMDIPLRTINSIFKKAMAFYK
jgi:hypothetical protein